MRLYFGLALLIVSGFTLWIFSAHLWPSNQYTTIDACKLQGMVIKVTDGDTINILDADKVKHKIRLAGIDAPERGQPFGTASTKFLAKHVNQKTVCVAWHKLDKYDRKVGVVSINDLDINHQIVVAGLAWHY